MEIAFDTCERPFIAQRLDLLAQLVEFRLARHLIEAAAEFVGHVAGLSRPLAGGPHHLGQILGTHHHKSDDEQEKDMAPAEKVEHGAPELPSPAFAARKLSSPASAG